VEFATGVAHAALAVLGAPHGAFAVGGGVAATVFLTSRRPRAVMSRIGSAAVSVLSTTPAVVAGASGVAARISRPSGTERVAGNA